MRPRMRSLAPNWRPIEVGQRIKHRDVIQATAAKVYARGRKGSYDLLTADF